MSLEEAMPEDKPKSVVRLGANEYASLEAQLPRISPSNTTTPEQYACWCGIQLVLQKLREGFTVGV